MRYNEHAYILTTQLSGSGRYGRTETHVLSLASRCIVQDKGAVVQVGEQGELLRSNNGTAMLYFPKGVSVDAVRSGQKVYLKLGGNTRQWAEVLSARTLDRRVHVEYKSNRFDKDDEPIPTALSGSDGLTVYLEGA